MISSPSRLDRQSALRGGGSFSEGWWIVDSDMRIWCGRILMSAYCTRIFGTGRRKRYRLRRTKSASSAGGERRCRPRGQSFCGRRDCADATQARRRGRCSPQIRVRQPEQRDKLENMVRTKSFKRALLAVRYWRIGGIGGLNHPITNPPILQ